MLTLVITGLLFRNTESFHDLIVVSGTYQEIHPTCKTRFYSEFSQFEIPLVGTPRFSATPRDAFTTVNLHVLTLAN